MENLNICSNEKLSFKYNDDWKLDEIPDNSNPDCIATLKNGLPLKCLKKWLKTA